MRRLSKASNDGSVSSTSRQLISQLAGLGDQEVLALAAANHRVLVSHDVSTMPGEFLAFIQNQPSPGVILISQELSYRGAIEGLLRVWSTTEAEDWTNVLSFLPR